MSHYKPLPSSQKTQLTQANGFLWFKEISAILIYAYTGRRIANHEMPNSLSKLTSFLVPEFRGIVNDLDVVKQFHNSTATNFGWRPRSSK
jgi:hypothetical protein